MTDSQPSPAEIMRRLDDVVKRFEDVSKDVREFRNWAERLYVPRGEWVEGRRADQGYIKDVAKDIAELQADRKNDQTWRRQILLAFAIAAFSAVVSVALFIATFLVGR